MSSAIKEVLQGNLSQRKAAEKYKIKPATLQHRVEKFKNKEDKISLSFSSKYTVHQVFSIEEESSLNEYITKCSKMHYGLTLVQVRKLAYEYAIALDRKHPTSWDEVQLAGIDWANGFRKRNSNLSLRKPENTSAARSFGFNKTAVNDFFKNLEDVLTRYKFQADRIFNFDESGISTVLNTPKILADKSQKQVGQLVSSERGELITFGGIISASGNTVPPIFVFPRVHYKNHFINGAPEGSLGVATRSGWINSDVFIDVLKHIQKYTCSSKENPLLLLCDNHESHVTIAAVNYCRDNGIVYLSFPPHTSHRLQPLDVGVFGPFKGKLKTAFNDWHVNHPGKTITIYEIPNLAKLAYFESFTGKNIISGFSTPGIWPFNKLAFGDQDFEASAVYSDKTHNSHDQNNQQKEVSQPIVLEIMSESYEKTISESNIPDITHVCGEIRDPTSIPSTSKVLITPEQIRSYPKVIRMEKGRRGRQPGKSRIYTDTPEKNRLQDLDKIKEQKRIEKERKKRAKDLKNAKFLLGLESIKPQTKICRPNTNKTNITESDTTSTSEDFETMDTSDGSDFCSISDNEMLEPVKELEIIVPENIMDEDFLLVKFEKKKSIVYYVGLVVSHYTLTEYKVSFLRKKPDSCRFVFPNVKDEASVYISDVVLHLPKPIITKGTNRTAAIYNFSVDLSSYNLQ